MKPVKVGLLGLGTVGAGTVNVLQRNAEEISRRAGRAIDIVQAAARDIKKPRACSLTGIALTDQPLEVINNPHTDIVVELIGGSGLARELTLSAIARGKHVITANKALIALHGNEIFAAAQKAGVNVAFEAAVAGGIPIIKAIREGLSGNRIQWLAGIINGTSNYILTQMSDAGRDFADVLLEAQALGYAEADPSFDIEGIDAAHKLTILASLAFGHPLQFEAVYIEGISTLTAQDISYANDLGYRIKHLGIARRLDEGIQMRVHPTLVPKRHMLANVDGVMNAAFVQADAVGPTLYYGPGAGAEPTASAVVADIVDVVRMLTTDPDHRVPHLAFRPDAIRDVPVVPSDAIRTAYYLRMLVVDQPGVLADITRILSDHSISIEAVVQREPAPGAEHVPLVLLTHQVIECHMNNALKAIEKLSSVNGPIMHLRVEQLDTM